MAAAAWGGGWCWRGRGNWGGPLGLSQPGGRHARRADPLPTHPYLPPQPLCPALGTPDDYAPPEKKARWFAFFYLCIPSGYALGYVYGGLIAAALGWRAAFYISAGVMVPFVALMFISRPLHLHGSHDAGPGARGCGCLGVVWRCWEGGGAWRCGFWSRETARGSGGLRG